MRWRFRTSAWMLSAWMLSAWMLSAMVGLAALGCGEPNEPPLLLAPEALGVGLDGTPLQLANLSPRAVVVAMWRTDCGLCRQEREHLEALQARFGDALAVVWINDGEPLEPIEAYLRQRPSPLRITRDPDGAVAESFAAEVVPFSAIISPGGHLVFTKQGFNSRVGRQIEAIVEQLLTPPTL